MKGRTKFYFCFMTVLFSKLKDEIVNFSDKTTKFLLKSFTILYYTLEKQRKQAIKHEKEEKEETKKHSCLYRRSTKCLGFIFFYL